ncbi:alkaline phosphatase family protein [Aliiglaciecola sp. CAU 1673]|uniref:alkaline phosphatase family protein n=1 Tax=Aliiglaciecola sp. CAU 1673 TaxID=3032595 RepID=UPI0023DC94E7|nr:alkaline phosphatase family protein [Aliiglaciecola sp. CAU 1673]MDF2176758.1 alkaline phosphatase family protein [Aliiglaciecola sp. CAU 1673]
MMKHLWLFLCISLGSMTAWADPPKLIVQITVDQLRGDLLQRYQKNFINQGNRKGFNRFLQQGTLYTNAHYRHALTLTAVGHATLATGALPSRHGVIANQWIDRQSGEPVYCTADASTQPLGFDGYSASPANLDASTFADELYFATRGNAKIFSVSLKDRGAVLTAGRLGKAFWMDKESGNMVSSSYYFDALPDYVQGFNQSGLKDNYLGKTWELSLPQHLYVNDAANRPFQIPPMGFSTGFPHQMPATNDTGYYKLLGYSPYGDELTADFARLLVEQHKLGKDDVTDYLSISFSTNDYVGHQFGPNSLEAEDNLLHLDKTLADFFYFLDKQVGLNNVLLVLSADHGIDSIPEYKKSIGFGGFRSTFSESLTQLNQALSGQFKVEGELIEKVQLPFLYLNHDLIAKQGLSALQVEQVLATKTLELPGVAAAFTRTQLMTQSFAPDSIGAMVQNGYYPARSGDVVLVQNASTLINVKSATSHGSPYKYDTHVPLYFAGWNIRPRTISRQVSPEDLAVTLSVLLQISQPDKATGKVLEEVLQ